MITIGKTPAGKPFTLPADAVTQTFAILAIKPRFRAPVKQARRPSTNGTGPVPSPDLDGITGGALRMLQRLAERHPETWTKAQLATLAKVKKTGGSFGTYISRLTTKGLIWTQGGVYGITDAGLDAMGGGPPAPLTREDLIAQWRGKLSGGGPRGTYLSRLVTNG